MRNNEFMQKLSEEKLVVIVAALSQLTMQLIANMATVIIPEIAMEMNVSADIQLYINIIYLCSLVAISIPLAKMIAQYGVKKSVKISCALLIISLLLCAFSFNFYMILLARFIQGVCCAILGISIYMMLVEELEDEALGTALGIVGSCGYVGLMLAPSLTGLITHYSDWRMAFLLLVPLFVVQLILLQMIKSEWTQEKMPIDKIGSIIYIAMMILFTIGLAELDSVYNIFIPISITLLVLFVIYEKRQEHPILNVSIFRNAKLAIGTNAAMATYFVTSIAITVLTYHLVYPSDMDLNMVGLILLITPLTMVFVSIIAGKMSSKVDPRKISGCALLLIGVSMLMLACLSYLSIELIILACLIQGIGHGFFSSPNNKYVLTLPEEKNLADTTAVLATSKEFGKILSSGIYTLLFASILENVVLGPPEYDKSLMFTNHIMMVITLVIVFSAAILLFYSLYKYERYENEAILSMVYNLTPKRFKESAKEALNLKDSAIDTTVKIKDVMNMNYVTKTASKIKDTTVDAAVTIKDTTMDTATTLKDTTIDTALTLKDTTVDTATTLKDTTVDTATSIKDTTVDAASTIKDTTVDAASNIKDTTTNTAKSTIDTTKETASNIKKKLK